MEILPARDSYIDFSHPLRTKQLPTNSISVTAFRPIKATPGIIPENTWEASHLQLYK